VPYARREIIGDSIDVINIKLYTPKGLRHPKILVQSKKNVKIKDSSLGLSNIAMYITIDKSLERV